MTRKKVRTTTSNLRTPSHQRRKSYRYRCKIKKILNEQYGHNVDKLPLIDHENQFIESNKYPCSYCNVFFQTQTDLLSHITSNHKDNNNNTNQSIHDSITTKTKTELDEYPDITKFTKFERTELLRRLLEMEQKDNDYDHNTYGHVKQETAIKKETGLNVNNNDINTSNIPILGQFNNNSFVITPIVVNAWMCKHCIKKNRNKDLFCAYCGLQKGFNIR